jgi:hypothetical protein
LATRFARFSHFNTPELWGFPQMATTTLFPLAFGGYDDAGIFFDASIASMTEIIGQPNESEFATFALTPDQISGIHNGSLTVTLQFDSTISDIFPN